MSLQQWINPLNVTQSAYLIQALDWSAFKAEHQEQVKSRMGIMKAALKQYLSPDFGASAKYYSGLDSLERDLKDLLLSVQDMLLLLNLDGQNQLETILRPAHAKKFSPSTSIHTECAAAA